MDAICGPSTEVEMIPPLLKFSVKIKGELGFIRAKSPSNPGRRDGNWFARVNCFLIHMLQSRCGAQTGHRPSLLSPSHPTGNTNYKEMTRRINDFK